MLGAKEVPPLPRILIAEDERSISNLIRLALAKEGYDCVCAGDGDEVVSILEGGRFDLVLLDVMLPKVDGFALMDFIRPLGVPVIFITARGDLADRIHGLRAGAEDYIVKPFEVAELLARVDVVLRRFRQTDGVMIVDGLTVDTLGRRVMRDDQEIPLTKTEYELLLLLMRNPGRALTREAMYEQVWGQPFRYGTKTVDLHVQRMRKKVKWEEKIVAVNRVGYRFEA